jgi:hypothetical protein
MTAKTARPPQPLVRPEAQPAPRPSAAANKAEQTRPQVYWGDRLTLFFWLFCFGLMVAMNLVDAVHRLVLPLLNHSSVP